MKLVDKWNEYVGPKDERIVAIENRVYKIAGLAIAFGVIALTLYQSALVSAAALGEVQGPDTYFVLPIACLWVAIVFLACAAYFARKGIVDNNRFAGVDRYPAGYFTLLSALAGIAFAAIWALILIVAQVQVLGFPEVAWAGDIATGLVGGTVVFVLCSIAFPLYFHSAKRNRDKDMDTDE